MYALKQTLFTKLVAKVAALTKADELLRPAAGGILPETVTNIPNCGPSDNSSYIPLTPHKK